MHAFSIRDFEAEARRRLSPAVYDLFAGGGGDEVTLRANTAAFARIGLVPRALRGSRERNLEVMLLGRRASMPIILAPTAFHRLAHPEGERASARAAARTGTIMIASMASTVAIEEIAAAARTAAIDADPDLWFQLYIQPDLGFTEAIVHRAEESGCKALVVTVDSPLFVKRERDLRNGFLDLPSGLCCENMRVRGAGDEWTPARPIAFSPELSWDHIDWLRRVAKVPIALKGISHPEDAALAVGHGVDALIVSNHGGRQLDTVPATIELLPGIADAVAGRIPLLLDGGIRRGTDVVKALALGATAVAIGRPALWGLAAAGEDGVAAVLELLRAELDHAMALCGCRSLQDLGRDLLRLPSMESRCWSSES
ncbi:MAG TPA: alpha-hydroxy acid oxidase [Myxococcales bacterium]